MDIIIIIKAFLVGLVWAGSFYLIASYILPIFPMPAMLYLRNRLLTWADKVAKRDERLGRRWWNTFKLLFKFMVGLFWLGLLAGYLYLLIPIMHRYFDLQAEQFWMAYGIALAFPTLWVLVRGILIYRHARWKPQT